MSSMKNPSLASNWGEPRSAGGRPLSVRIDVVTFGRGADFCARRHIFLDRDFGSATLETSAVGQGKRSSPPRRQSPCQVEVARARKQSTSPEYHVRPTKGFPYTTATEFFVVSMGRCAGVNVHLTRIRRASLRLFIGN